MKRLTILFMLFLTSFILYAKDRKGNDLSGPIALKGELTEKYQNYTKGTPIVIRGVRKMRISPDETAGTPRPVPVASCNDNLSDCSNHTFLVTSKRLASIQGLSPVSAG